MGILFDQKSQGATFLRIENGRRSKASRTRITEEQVDEFKDGFELFDVTGEGIIPWSQCANVARCFGFNPLEEQVKLLLAGGDEENMPKKEDMATKSIHFDDFLGILWGIATANTPGSYEDFYEGLKVFDKDGGGNISGAELRHVMSSLGEKLSSEEVNFLLDGMEDLNGCVSYEKFIKKLMSDNEDPNAEAE